MAVNDFGPGWARRAKKKSARDLKRKRDAEQKYKDLAAEAETDGGGPHEAHRVVSAAQMKSAPTIKDEVPEGYVRNDNGYGFKKDDEGIMCGHGCGKRIVGTLNDVIAHNQEFHSNA